MAAAAAVLSATAALVIGTPGTGSAATPSLRAFGISGDGTLMATFTTDRPQVLDWVRAITGFVGDTRMVGIDFRVQDGLMYGVGDKGGIYTIKIPSGTTDVVVTKVSQLQFPLNGTTFDIDFNPAADRLRVISDYGQNLRHNLNDHTTISDLHLTTPPTEGSTQGVTAAAYTNNDLDPTTATTLFDINTISDQVVIQSPANNGTLAPTGNLGVNAGLNAGLDIFSYRTNGKTTSVAAFASLTPSGASTPSLYSINLFTGESAPIGQFPLNITDLAITISGS
ncbi:DUF4394 domain-containing protein [Streptomyces sp. NPDC013178]|uniref:DUF4394 domain-containing protein n=1 Tax=unclassified Streptomyces TaxID=2593676 RepID=UPI0033DFBDD2